MKALTPFLLVTVVLAWFGSTPLSVGLGENLLRIGVVGLDTAHAPDYSKIINDAAPDDSTLGVARVVAAYHPYAEDDVAENMRRISEMGAGITGSLDELLRQVDVVMLHTTDGRRRLPLALQILKSKKRLWMNKPIAHNLTDVIAIYRAAEEYEVPVFSASSLRYVPHALEIREGKYGLVLGASVYSPAYLDDRHVDFFWYGVHGVETLFTVMGLGCKSVVRTHAGDTDVITGVWSGDRVGTVRGGRNWKAGGARRYGGVVWCEKDVVEVGPFAGYEHLVRVSVQFLETGLAPVQPEETIQMYAFMEAADLSKNAGGIPVSVTDLTETCKQRARVRLREVERGF